MQCDFTLSPRFVGISRDGDVNGATTLIVMVDALEMLKSRLQGWLDIFVE